MKRFAIVALISCFAATSAFAADMAVKAPPAPPPPPAATWTGSYIGVNGGWGEGTTDQTDEFGVTTQEYRQHGGLVGGTYGSNYQVGRWVLGVESDFDFSSIKGNFTSATLCSLTGGSVCFTDLKNFSTDRLRAGIDLNGWLLYGTGGLGYGEVNAGQNPCGATVFGGVSCHEQWRGGWVAGAGVEKMFLPHWSAKIEYLHFDFGNRSQYTSATVGGGNFVNVLERGDILRGGIDYHFDLASLLHLN